MVGEASSRKNETRTWNERLPSSLSSTPGDGEPPMLKVADLRYLDFGPFSFSVERGRCLGVSGPSGSGKSLMLRALADLDPHAGSVGLDGVDAGSIPAHEWRQRVGYLPASSAWWAERVGDHFAPGTVIDSLGFGNEVLDWEVRRLSSGEKQRLGLLRMLAQSPEVLLLDEPSANLDPENAAAVEALLLALLQDGDRAMVLVSHDEAQLERLANDRLVLV